MTVIPRQLRIGVDCGGTNTDAVIVDLTPSPTRSPDSVVLASFKTPTTPEVTHGIRTAIKTVLDSTPSIQPSDIQAVSIGTTHFVNALVTRATNRLDRVASVRLCGPFSRRARPFVGFPNELRAIMEGPTFFVEGGCHIDGKEISQIDEGEIQRVCEEIKKEGIKSVAISAVFAPIDFDHRQEERVEAMINKYLPNVRTTISKNIANAGLLARENATILNASLVRFAESTVQGFRSAIHALNLSCPVFVTSNDGCLMTLDTAARFPIRTFSSGPTNSMRGAGFLATLASGSPKRETALVMDIGGTTTEIGVLLPSGFPRQAANQHYLCGVRLNFAMPHVSSMGLGGGSLVAQDETSGKVTVGPSSVGYKITEEALLFGGKTLTATDICVASGLTTEEIGNSSLVAKVDKDLVSAASARIKTMIELSIDSMKTTKADIPLYLAGGGAILCPNQINGVSKVHRFPHYQCANAVGAAIAEVSAQVDMILETAGHTLMELQRQMEKVAIARAVEQGALESQIKIIEAIALPVAYVAGRCRFVIKAAGEWSGVVPNGHIVDRPATADDNAAEEVEERPSVSASTAVDKIWTATEIEAYRPDVKNRSWNISELDTEMIAIGNYILGCGGGGDPETSRIALIDMLRRGATVKVREIGDVPQDMLCGWGGMMGSPEVGSERLLGEEYVQATKALWEFLKLDRKDIAGMIANEIGGSNGLVSMVNAASSMLDLPVIDGDFMGRAYPTGWQTTCNVYDDNDRGEILLPSCSASGDGVEMFLTKVKHYKECDSVARAAGTELGQRTGHAHRPLPVPYCRKSMVANTLSLSWRIGRSVLLAEKTANIGNIGQVIIDAAGGDETGRVLFEGKIVEVERRTYKGHLHGSVVIEPVATEEEDASTTQKAGSLGSITIPFKNENLLVEHTSPEGKKTILCTVPDLICVIDAGNGRSLGTQDFKYGLRVVVVGIAAAPQWTSTERAVEMGGPKAFGYDLPYKPLGKYVKPRSVIDEFNVDS